MTGTTDGDTPATDDNTEETSGDAKAVSSAAAPEMPTDMAGWRSLLASVPPKDLLLVIQQDRYLTARVLTGFRSAPDTLRRPQVLDRLAKEISLVPKIAEAVAALQVSVPPVDNKSQATMPALRETVAPVATGVGEEKDKSASALRETVNRQKTTLREKEARIAELEAVLVSTRKEREQVQADRDTARAAQKTAEAEAERQHRLLEREQRKQTAPKTPSESGPKVSAAAPPTAVAPTVSVTSALEEALTRLLNRSRWETVADVCREALGHGATGDPLPTLVRGRIHALYASALYGQGDSHGGEEQDKLATVALMDAGDAPGAAEALARMLTHALAVKPTWGPLLKRLEQLAAHTGQADAVQEVFRRLHIASPDAHRRLLAILGGGSGGKRASGLLAAPRANDGPPLGPDESVLLTVPGGIALPVTARRIAEAVDSGEEEWVLRLHRILISLRQAGGAEQGLAERLLAAVTNLQAVAVQPFLHPVLRAILVDASNVARHNPDPLAQYLNTGTKQPLTARIWQLTQMRDFLLGRGYFPVLLIADATLSFHADEPETYRDLVARHIVYEVPSGTSADEVLLSEARLRRAPLVSNDTFSDWDGGVGDLDRFWFDFSTGRVALTPVK